LRTPPIIKSTIAKMACGTPLTPSMLFPPYARPQSVAVAVMNKTFG
jgi:hypothetical protein